MTRSHEKGSNLDSQRRAASLGTLATELEATLDRMDEFERRYATQLEIVHPRQRRGALNLVDYLALRQSGTGTMATGLAELGLSTLDHIEAHARASVSAVLDAVRALRADPTDGRATPSARHPVSVSTGRARIRRQTTRLFGPKRQGPTTRIMVTMPSEAADDYGLVLAMVKAGMNLARINCAHDGPEVWRRMVDHIREASNEVGRDVRIFMDLAGPKIRIGRIAPGPAVLRISPTRDERGRVVRPRLVSIVADTRGTEPLEGVRLPITAETASALIPGARLDFTDTRGAPVSLEIEDVVDGVGRAWLHQTVYVETGVEVALRQREGGTIAQGTVGALPAREERLRLRNGDVLTLHKEDRPGESPLRKNEAGGPKPGHVSCTLPAVVDALHVGDPVFISDGKVQGEVIALRPGEADIRIVRAGLDGAKVKGFKGLNLPHTDLGLYGLTEKDREDLAFVVAHADGVNVSFLNHPDDVEDLLDELERAGGHHLGLVLKIETRGAVEHLPAMLLAAMEWPTIGVMVARGDLAVEAGWVELAEVIEEILMACEAAHVPAIWATEVLSQLAKKGVPARGEISDVVMAGRAECVMLNKGPYITDAIRGLDVVLARLESYRSKRATWLPELRLQLPDSEEVGRAVGTREGRWL